MGWFRKQGVQAHETAAWDGPFAPPAPGGRPRFHPALKTAAQLVPSPVELPSVGVATEAAIAVAAPVAA
jgi:hypothetical protein